MGCSFFRIQEELGLGGDLYKIESLNIIVQQTEKRGGVWCYLRISGLPLLRVKVLLTCAYLGGNHLS